MRFDPVKKPDGVALHVSGLVRERLRPRSEDRLRAAAVRQRRRPVRSRRLQRGEDQLQPVPRHQPPAPAATTSTATSSPSRTVADPDALRLAYQTGRVNDGAQGPGDDSDHRHPAVHRRAGRRARHLQQPHHARALSRPTALRQPGAPHLRAGMPIQRVQQANLDEIEQWVAASRRTRRRQDAARESYPQQARRL